MRVLLLHNRYRAEGGEERAVADLEGMLARRGHTVARLERSSADTGSLTAARALVGGGSDPEAVGAAVRRLRADVVHAHNLHPRFGWRALAAARAAGARTVLHLHNYRLFCAIGIAYRDGAPCFRCRRADTWPGLRLRCRGSLGEAAVYAAGLRRQQPGLFEHADRFVAVSQATATRLIELGLPAARTTALLNFIPATAFAAESRAAAGEYALVSGRLVAEKGFDTAIAAAWGAGVPLVVAGSGPDEGRLRGLAAGGEVRFTGRVAPTALAQLRAAAAVVLAPSRWDEPCPYSVSEAMADGVPVLVSDRGGLPELAGSDATLAADNVAGWTEALGALWGDPAARGRAGSEALEQARERCSEDRYYERLMEIYQ
ncbi:MAG: glycosyltransferase family 4 protein [Solirubrobacteraceae bacterium]